MHKILKIVFVFMIILVMPGCLSYHVGSLGKIEYNIYPKSVCVDKSGNIVCKIGVNSRKGSDYNAKSVGVRFLILNADYAMFAVRRIMQGEAVEGKLYVPIDKYLMPDGAIDARKADSWYLYPPDLDTIINEPYLPVHINIDDLKCYPVTLNENVVQIEYPAGDNAFLLDVFVGKLARYDSEIVDDPFWASPVRAVLFIPALIVDVVFELFS